MRSFFGLLVLLCSIAPASVLAQTEAASSAEDRPGIKVNEVEHGLFFGAEAGGFFLFSPKASGESGFSPGRSIGVTVGTDIGQVLSAGILVLGTSTSTPTKFVGTGNTKMRGDFSSFIIGGVLKADLVGWQDVNAVKRVFITARAGGGLAIIGPKDYYPGNEGVVLGGLGIEYFTHLRHFSVGLNADFVMGLSYMGPGLMVSPNMRYTF